MITWSKHERRNEGWRTAEEEGVRLGEKEREREREVLPTYQHSAMNSRRRKALVFASTYHQQRPLKESEGQRGNDGAGRGRGEGEFARDCV